MELNPSARVLLTGPSNTAVDNMLVRLKPKNSAVRIGSIARACEDAYPYLLEEVAAR